jgi:site-specific DNA-methyltransferase (adenine-specific)
MGDNCYGEYNIPKGETAPATPEAKQWEGWGTALKPANEPIVLARKPLSEKTVAANVLKWGTGALNIDGGRVKGKPRTTHKDGNKVGNRDNASGIKMGDEGVEYAGAKGRWPANVILDELAGAALDEQSGVSKPKAGRTGRKGGNKGALGEFGGSTPDAIGTWPEDKGGGASRFFYCPKPSKAERNAGTDEKGCFHPTVKPIKLIRYLCRLITPPDGVILDPFLGSGTTALAAIAEGFEWIGIEREDEYVKICEARINHAILNKEGQGELF